MERVTYLKLRQSTVSLIIRIVGLTLFLLLFWWAKSALFGWLGDLTGVELFNRIAAMSFLFWVSVGFYGFLLAGLVVRWYTIVYEIFTDRIAIRSGLVSRKSRIVSMGDFSQFQVQQGVWGRIFGYGTIEFMYRTIGPTGGYGEVFYNVHDPDTIGMQLRSLLQMADTKGERSMLDTTSTDEKHKRDAEAVTVAAQAGVIESGAGDVTSDTETVAAEVVEPDDASESDEGRVSQDDISGEIQL